jgi:hypothetical protein
MSEDFQDPEHDGEEIPVVEVHPAEPPVARPPATTGANPDWTRTEPVRDDPGTLGEEARRLWDSVREQFVEPLVRNYPEAAGQRCARWSAAPSGGGQTAARSARTRAATVRRTDSFWPERAE